MPSAKRTIVLPPKGAKAARTKETWERDHDLMLSSQDTMHQWGRTAVQRLINDADRLGITVEVK
jgi:hypothetical protein